LKTDSRLVNRLVGFYEYYHALRRFDALLKTATADDLKTIEEIIQDRRELAIYTNLSRHVHTGTSSLAQRPGKPRDDFKRHGLAWVVALARVEVAAMFAGFTRTKRPFASVPPSRLELSAYKELMLDGLRTHYWTLAADPRLRKVTSGDLKLQEMLTYSRRLFVTRCFHETVKKLGRSDFNSTQQAELKSWGKNLEELHVTIYLQIQEQLKHVTAKQAKDLGIQYTGGDHHAPGDVHEYDH